MKKRTVEICYKKVVELEFEYQTEEEFEEYFDKWIEEVKEVEGAFAIEVNFGKEMEK